MDTKVRKRLLELSALGLLIAGLIFLGLSIFGADKKGCLPVGLGCIALGNLFNILRSPYCNPE